MRYEDLPEIGLTWGVWDLLHVGHLRLLMSAAFRCKRLHVGVTTDELALERKGREPVIPYEQRVEMLEAYAFVQVVFPQSHKLDKAWAVREYKPDVLFVADDWTPQTFEGEGLGVPVVYLPRTRETSTTQIIERACRVRR